MDLGKDKKVNEIVSRLKAWRDGDGPVKVDGTWGSFAPMLAAHIQKTLNRPVLFVSPHIDDADNAADDLSVFLDRRVETFPVWEGQEDFIDASDEIGAGRLRLALELAEHKSCDNSELVISTCVQALNQPVPKPDILRDGGLKLEKGRVIEPELISAWLTDNGFERVDRIDLPGQYARRGGIIDIFAPVVSSQQDSFSRFGRTSSEPVRVEFFGDQIESIRRIDLDTQRSSDKIDDVRVISSKSRNDSLQQELFVNLLPEDTIIILTEPTDIAEVSEVFLSRVDNPDNLYSWRDIYHAIGNYNCLELSRFGGGSSSGAVSVDVTSAAEFEHKPGAMWKSKKAVLAELISRTQDSIILLYCENEAEIDRVGEIIRESEEMIPDNFKLRLGFIHQGFIINSLNVIVVSHHEIFGQYAIRRRIRTIRNVSPIGGLIDLNKGDYVVHISYGIGKFIGIQTMEKGNNVNEYLTIEYANKTLIYVPVQNINLVQKYIGSMPKRPRLNVIGSKKWENQKARAAKGVQELASQLLETQARRESSGGIAFEPDTAWQKEFEESFLYQETVDQLKAAEEIKSDMTNAISMDRLLCGDVGYGKTELAMRSAFKAVESGKQVAVLVPTTVLCVQHGRTFAERFADFPITIEILNRFKTPKESKDIIARTRKGQVDIVIGTHRLLSEDVGFKDLGLLIIDEEQRFGVEHKERLKRFRVNVDVLTMTATPIPRTLHMSLLGLRDISSLSTPPLDRRSIVTKVCRYEKNLIHKAIMHEINRDGQVFFLHNRVQSINRTADEICSIINDPKVRVDVAHGQMSKHELEDAMIKFVLGQTDVLVCSTIIESGIDIPNANTMIINDADRFGLAQLHQLRGRVGRYKHRAYAYMLLPVTRTITPIAARRLKAIEEYSQLGAGFRIALRDLEIRGAGNILGPQQSGHINMVGYEMYCRLLADAVKNLRNEPIEKTPNTVIDLGISTYIPKNYISSDRERMDVYRRIALAGSEKELSRMTDELADMFGPVPIEVQMLLDMTELRLKAFQRGIKSIIISGLDLVFTFEQHQQDHDLFSKAPGIVRIPDTKTVHIRLTKNYFEPLTLMSILRKMFSCGRKKRC